MVAREAQSGEKATPVTLNCGHSVTLSAEGLRVGQSPCAAGSFSTGLERQLQPL